MTQPSHITFVSAGAGSGKTYTLTQILRDELVAGRAQPGGVIATTFTRKAASELRERVRGFLLEKGEFALATAMGQARIGTVNSICGELLQRFCFEAGLSAEQQVIEEATSRLLLQRAIDSVQDASDLDELLVIARRLGLEKDWQEDLAKLVGAARSNDIAPDLLAGFATTSADSLLAHFPTATKTELSAELLTAIREAINTIEPVNSDKKNTQGYLNQLKDAVRPLSQGILSWSVWADLATAAPEAKLKAAAEPVADIAKRYAEHPQLQADLGIYLERIFSLCAKALDTFAELKRERGALDFVDQENLLLTLLDNPHVSETLAEELDLLLVDEFQDTSPIQLALFLKLASLAKRVFWVGDIKQAIYGFRGSDSELMLSILASLDSLGGAKQVLPASWRSRPPLVKLVNELFAPAFANTLAREEVVLKPERTEILAEPAFADWVLEGRNAGLIADSLALGIRRLVSSGYVVCDKSGNQSHPVRYADIAILVRTNTEVTATAAALQRAGIPSATAQPGLLATPEATLAMACLRRLNDPSDTVATAEIVSLADCAEPEMWVADRLRYLAAGGDPAYWREQATADQPPHAVLGKIAALRAQLPLLAPREALQVVIDECDLPGIVVRWSANPDTARARLANLEALLTAAGTYEDECRSEQIAASLSGLVLWFAELANAKEDMRAEASVDAVRIMTQHASKGLEWPVVVLTGLSSDIKTRLWDVVSESGDHFDAQTPLSGRTIRYWPWPFGDKKKVTLAEELAISPIGQTAHQSAVEEGKRLLYVAMTRARDLLVIARQAKKTTGEWIDSLEAPWLLPETTEDRLSLPNGDTVEASCWGLDAESEPNPVPLTDLPGVHSFVSSDVRQERLPLVFAPSSANLGDAKILEQVAIGQRLALMPGTDITVLGTAIHACIALSFVDVSQPITNDEADRLLRTHGLEGKIVVDALLAQINAFHHWMTTRWSQHTPYPEIPVQAIWQNGQIMNGRIDLLLDTPDGWVLIDHKSNPQGSSTWEGLAQRYAGQLDAYATAIKKATGRPVVERWLFLPVSGCGLKV